MRRRYPKVAVLSSAVRPIRGLPWDTDHVPRRSLRQRSRSRREADDRGVPDAETRDMSMIEVTDLTKAYGDTVAVDHLTFSAREGVITGFLGPNGAGKTSTLRMLLGLAAPTSGTATIAGRRYGDLRAPYRHVGAVLESTGFHPGRRAQDHLR